MEVATFALRRPKSKGCQVTRTPAALPQTEPRLSVPNTGPEMLEAARQELVKLQQGDAENKRIWEQIRAISQKQFDGLFERMAKYWQGQDVFVQDCFRAPTRPPLFPSA